MSRALWLAGARIGVAVVVLGTGAVVRANVASGPSSNSDEAAATTTTIPASDAADAAAAVPDDAVPDDAVPDDDQSAGAATTVLVAAPVPPVPPVEEPTAQTAAPTHVRSVDAVWIDGRENVLQLRAGVADVCTAEVKLEENANLVYVYVFERPSTGETCAASETGVLTAELDGPLGARLVIDAVTGEQFVVGLSDPGATAP